MEQLSLFEYYNCNRNGYDVLDGNSIEERFNIMLDVFYDKKARDLGISSD